MDPTELALGAGLIGIILTLMLIGAVLWYFISAIGYYKMYQKAGEKGWKAFIPYYKNYIRFKIAWEPKYFWPFSRSCSNVGIIKQRRNCAFVDLLGSSYRSCNYWY